MFIGSDFLPNPSFPIIFDSVTGQCLQLGPSSYNDDEVAATMRYANKIINDRKVSESDIGIFYLFISRFVVRYAFFILSFQSYFEDIFHLSLKLNIKILSKIVQFLIHSISNLGIVSPYRAQCCKIREACERQGYNRITIGSAEAFQGQERSVMIVSTVRSNEELGNFVKNERVR